MSEPIPHLEDVILDVDGGIATVTINRPHRRNALERQTYVDLVDALRWAEYATNVGAVVITGAGERAFSAGGDLSMARRDLVDSDATRQHNLDRMIALSTVLTNMTTPTICAVRGVCVGGGAELSLFTDLVIAGDDAMFWFNGTSVGGCSWWGAPQLLPHVIGLRQATQVLLYSERIPADRALELGLVKHVVPATDVPRVAREWADRLLDLSNDGIKQTKASLRSVKEQMLQSMSAAAEQNASAMDGPDIRAAFAAFQENRSVSWRDLRDRKEVV